MSTTVYHWYAKNNTAKSITVNGLFLPTILSGQTVDLLLYEAESRLSANPDIRSLQVSGSLTIRKTTEVIPGPDPDPTPQMITEVIGTSPLTLTLEDHVISGNISAATSSAAGTMSVTDKTKLDGLQAALDGKASVLSLTGHTEDIDNPHQTTAAQVGAYTVSETDTLLSGKAELGDLSSSGTAPLTLGYSTSTGEFTGSIALSSATQNGYLSSTDWSAFDAKLDLDSLSASGSSPLTLSYNSSTGAFSGSIAVATATQNGYLSSGDWTTFDNKLDTADLSGYVPFSGGTANLNLGAYTITAGGEVIVSTTTPQQTVKYDTANYYTTTVSSAGAVTFDAVGTSSGFIFSDSVAFSAGISNGAVDFTVQTNKGSFTVDGNTTTGPVIDYDINASSAAAFTAIRLGNGTMASGTSGSFTNVHLNPTINQSGTAGYTVLKVSSTETGVGSGSKLLADMRVGGVSKFSVSSAGVITGSYDTSNYFTTTVSAAGLVTFNAVGASAGFVFNSDVSTPSVSNLSGDLTFADASGTTTLTSLKSMRNVWISVTGQSEGNLTISDATNWDTQYSFISSIKVVTASTDWDMWLCETSAFNTSLITSRKIAQNVNGNYDISIMREYNSDSNNVYLIYTDTSGTNTASILISGEARRH